MMEVSYRITGLDCAACADKVERHLNLDPRIEYARLDNVNGVLCLTFKEDELSKAALLALIAEVEDDDIHLLKMDEGEEGFFGKEQRLLLARILIAIAAFFTCGFFFHAHYWVRFAIYLATYVLIAYDLAIQVVKNIIKKQNPLDEYLLILVASAGAFVLASLKYAKYGSATAIGNDVFIFEEHYEAILVCLLWQIGELLQDFAVKKSRNAVLNAVKSQVGDCLVLKDGTPTRISVKKVVPGDIVVLGKAEAVPVDGKIVSGSAHFDTSSLTGESLPVYLSAGQEVCGGYLLTDGEVQMEASKDYDSSSSAKILEMVSSSLRHKGKVDRIITRFARVYTPVIFGVAVLYIVLAGLLWTSWEGAVFTGLEMLVISCPCALVISVPLAYFASVGLASKNGIIVKNAVSLDTLYETRLLISDKTGTLSSGVFSVCEEEVVDASKKEEFANALLSLESRQQHPIAASIRAHYEGRLALPVEGFDAYPGEGVRGKVDGKLYYAGNEKLLERLGFEAVTQNSEGVNVFLCDEDGILGYLTLADGPKEQAKATVQGLAEKGIETMVLSGDKPSRVAAFAQQIGVTSYKGGLLPEDKLAVLEEKKGEGNGSIAFLGDGVNDAPALARADVGIAMGASGSALACEEADVILLRDDPSMVLKTLRVSKICRITAVTNIIFALTAKLAVMMLAIVLGERMPMEIAVLADTGVSVLATLHSLLILSRKV
ncbi:MAG: cadmium-translocating P-type ATPase [Bacilli bacterium]|nr:cadmium-translocating P-type ATPase [Bacilli bacterium]